MGVNKRVFLLWLLAASGFALPQILAASAAVAEEPITRLQIEGAARTRATTIQALLPRTLPAVLTAAEQREFERRVRNLGIFDDVSTSVAQDVLVVRVQEKFTLSPVVAFSSGATWADSYALLGATEHNFLGTASALSAFVSWEQRGPTGVVKFSQHPYARGRMAMEVTGYFTSSDFRFADVALDPSEANDPGWVRRQAGMDVYWKVPFAYDAAARFQFGMFAMREWSTDATTLSPPAGGLWTGGAFVAELDWYTFSDLLPSGWRTTLEAFPGVLLPSGQLRPEATLTNTFALRLWPYAVFMGRIKASGVWGGNVNHTMLLGSVEGVRGLADTFYRNRALAFSNLELRQSLRVAKRFALQAVAFADTGAFAPMDINGSTQAWQSALSLGAGIRCVPTFLTGIVLRLDAAQPLRARNDRNGSLFFQFGLSQYF